MVDFWGAGGWWRWLRLLGRAMLPHPPPLFFVSSHGSFFVVMSGQLVRKGGASVSFVVWSYELLLSLVLGVERGRSSMLTAEMVRDPWRDVSCVQLPFD